MYLMYRKPKILRALGLTIYFTCAYAMHTRKCDRSAQVGVEPVIYVFKMMKKQPILRSVINQGQYPR